MAWYPKKFVEGRQTHAGELDEWIPPPGNPKRRWMKRMVHFDIDPSNGKVPRFSLVFPGSIPVDGSDWIQQFSSVAWTQPAMSMGLHRGSK